MEEIDVRVVTIPVEVEFTCPSCCTENDIDFDEFQHNMVSIHPIDWEGQILKCKNCGKKFKVENIEWD